MAMSRAAALAFLAVTGCANEPIRPIVPLTPEATVGVYDVTLQEVKRLMTSADTTRQTIRPNQYVYLNSRILLPPADSANPLEHDAQWLASVQDRGLVNGVCSKTGPILCPDSVPLAFISLGVPWTRGGDSVFVVGGYVGQVPNRPSSAGVFWQFMVVKKEGTWLIARRGEPNVVSFQPLGRRS
jgi:hypothetical protein